MGNNTSSSGSNTANDATTTTNIKSTHPRTHHLSVDINSPADGKRFFKLSKKSPSSSATASASAASPSPSLSTNTNTINQPPPLLQIISPSNNHQQPWSNNDSSSTGMKKLSLLERFRSPSSKQQRQEKSATMNINTLNATTENVNNHSNSTNNTMMIDSIRSNKSKNHNNNNNNRSYAMSDGDLLYEQHQRAQEHAGNQKQDQGQAFLHHQRKNSTGPDTQKGKTHCDKIKDTDIDGVISPRTGRVTWRRAMTNTDEVYGILPSKNLQSLQSLIQNASTSLAQAMLKTQVLNMNNQKDAELVNALNNTMGRQRSLRRSDGAAAGVGVPAPVSNAATVASTPLTVMTATDAVKKDTDDDNDYIVKLASAAESINGNNNIRVNDEKIQNDEETCSMETPGTTVSPRFALHLALTSADQFEDASSGYITSIDGDQTDIQQYQTQHKHYHQQQIASAIHSLRKQTKKHNHFNLQHSHHHHHHRHRRRSSQLHTRHTHTHVPTHTDIHKAIHSRQLSALDILKHNTTKVARYHSSDANRLSPHNVSHLKDNRSDTQSQDAGNENDSNVSMDVCEEKSYSYSCSCSQSHSHSHSHSNSCSHSRSQSTSQNVMTNQFNQGNSSSAGNPHLSRQDSYSYVMSDHGTLITGGFAIDSHGLHIDNRPILMNGSIQSSSAIGSCRSKNTHHCTSSNNNSDDGNNTTNEDTPNVLGIPKLCVTTDMVQDSNSPNNNVNAVSDNSSNDNTASQNTNIYTPSKHLMPHQSNLIASVSSKRAAQMQEMTEWVGTHRKKNFQNFFDLNSSPDTTPRPHHSQNQHTSENSNTAHHLSPSPFTIDCADLQSFKSQYQISPSHADLHSEMKQHEFNNISYDNPTSMDQGMDTSENGTDSVTLSADDLHMLGVIGRGQNGSVMKAIHLPTLTRVALKTMNVNDKPRRQQLVNELQTMIRLAECEYLVPFLGAYAEAETGASMITLACQYMDCGSLRTFAKHLPNNHLTADKEYIVHHIAKQVLRGLHYLHSHHTCHRDIKPDNILLAHSGDCKIGDFGLALHFPTHHTNNHHHHHHHGEFAEAGINSASDVTVSEEKMSAHTFVGTLSYLAPERLLAEEYSYPSDIWSYGLTMAYICIGALPAAFTDYWVLVDMFQKASGTHKFLPIPLVTVEQGWSSELCGFIQSALILDPHQRPSAAQLLIHPFITSEKYKHSDIQRSTEFQYSRVDNEADMDIVLGLIVDKFLTISSPLISPSSSSSSIPAGTQATKLISLDPARLQVLATQFGVPVSHVQQRFINIQSAKLSIPNNNTIISSPTNIDIILNTEKSKLINDDMLNHEMVVN